MKRFMKKFRGLSLSGVLRRQSKESRKAAIDLELDMLREHWSGGLVPTDIGFSKRKAVPKNKLLPGELAAVVFDVGCYTIRSADMLYKYKDDDMGPAQKGDLDRYKRELHQNGLFDFLTDLDDLYPARRISAKHHGSESGDFVTVCRLLQKGLFPERIEAILTAKESAGVSDDSASLFVLVSWIGDSMSSIDWYKLSPNEKVMKLAYSKGYEGHNREARFVEHPEDAFGPLSPKADSE